MEDRGKIDWAEIIAPAWIIFGGLALRLFHLGRQSLWTDEIAAVIVAGQSLIEVVFTIATRDVSPPLYYLILHFWMKLGTSEFSLRLLSVLLAGGSMVGVFLIAKNLFDKTTAYIALAILAFCPLSIYLAQDVQNFTLLEFETVFAIFGYLQLKKGKGWHWPAIPILAGLYTHYYFFLIIFTLIIWFMLDVKSKGIEKKPFLKATLVPLVLWLPWLIVLSVQATGSSYQFLPFISPGRLLLDLSVFLTIGHAHGLSPWTAQPVTLKTLIFTLPFLAIITLPIITVLKIEMSENCISGFFCRF